MSRLTNMLIPVCSFGFLWLGLITGILPVTLPSAWLKVVTPLPLYALIVFGCYSLASVGYSVFCVESDDEAATQLMKDIDDAKQALKEKGFIFD